MKERSQVKSNLSEIYRLTELAIVVQESQAEYEPDVVSQSIRDLGQAVRLLGRMIDVVANKPCDSDPVSCLGKADPETIRTRIAELDNERNRLIRVLRAVSINRRSKDKVPSER